MTRPSIVVIFLAISLCIISVTSTSASLSVRHISLERLVGMSQLIVVAERVSTPQRVRVKITDPKSPGQRYPDFEYSLSDLKITEVLHARRVSEQITPGQTLKVAPAAISEKLDLHRRYHVEGVRKIPIRERYRRDSSADSSADSSTDTPGTRSIYFLRRCRLEDQDYWCLTVSGATESLQHIQAIRALIPMR